MHIIETIAHCNLHCQSKHRSNITKDSSFSVACFSHIAHGVRLFEITCCQPLQQLIYLRRSRKGCSRELTAATSTELPSCSEARAVPSKKKEKCAYMEAEEVGRPCEKQSNTNRTNDRPTLRNRHGFGLFDMLTWSAASLYPLKVLFPVHPPYRLLCTATWCSLTTHTSTAATKRLTNILKWMSLTLLASYN